MRHCSDSKGWTPQTLTVDVVQATLADFERVLNRTRVLRAGWLARADVLSREGSSPDSETSLTRASRAPRRRAKSEAAQAKVLDEQPEVADAYANGELGAEYLEIIALAIARLADAERLVFQARIVGLVEFARRYPFEAFRRHVNSIVEQLVHDGLNRQEQQKASVTVRKWVDPFTGMYCIRGELDPETGERVFNALDAETAAIKPTSGDLTRDQRAAAAFANRSCPRTAQRGPRGPRSSCLPISRRCCTGCMTTVCASTRRAPSSRSKRPDGCVATQQRSGSLVLMVNDSCWISVGRGGPRVGRNVGRYAPSTRPARSRTAPSGSTSVRCTMWSRSNTAVGPTYQYSSRCVPNITTNTMRAAGNSRSTNNEPSPSDDPTEPSTQ